MKEKLRQKIIECHKKYAGNVAKIMIQLGREGYTPPSARDIRSCLYDQENKSLENSSSGNVQKKVGKRENSRGDYGLCGRV